MNLNEAAEIVNKSDRTWLKQNLPPNELRAYVKLANTRKLDICREFSRGFADSVGLQPRKLAESDHWLAGYDAGYYCRKVKNEALDKYLVSIGHEPQAIIRPCDSVPNKEKESEA